MHAPATGGESPRPRPWLPARGPSLQSTPTVDGLETRSKSLAGTVKIQTVDAPATGGKSLHPREPKPPRRWAGKFADGVPLAPPLLPLAGPSLLSNQTLDDPATGLESLRPREPGPSLLSNQTMHAPVPEGEISRHRPWLPARASNLRSTQAVGDAPATDGKSLRPREPGPSLLSTQTVDSPPTGRKSLAGTVRHAEAPATRRKSLADTVRNAEAPATGRKSLAGTVKDEETSLVHLQRCRRWEALLSRFNRVAHLPLTAKGLTAALEACYHVFKGPEALAIIDTLRSRGPDKPTQAR